MRPSRATTRVGDSETRSEPHGLSISVARAPEHHRFFAYSKCIASSERWNPKMFCPAFDKSQFRRTGDRWLSFRNPDSLDTWRSRIHPIKLFAQHRRQIQPDICKNICAWTQWCDLRWNRKYVAEYITARKIGESLMFEAHQCIKLLE